MRIARRISVTAAAVGAFSLLSVACGDDGGDGGVPDTGVDAPTVDAMPIDGDVIPDPSGTIAVLDLTVSNPGITASGATVNISYTDTQVADVDPVVGEPTPPLGQCSVWVYDVGQTSSRPGTDEGTVTISGALSPVGTCTFDGTDYTCSSGGGTLPTATTISAPNASGLVTLFATGAFTGHDLAGARVSLSGFTNAENNGTFMVIDQDGIGNTITILHPGAVAETLTADGSFTAITGAGPTPAARDFLGADTMVTIEKAEGTRVPGFSATLTASGEGLTLSDDSAQPHALPVDPAAEATFSCNPGANGVCGPNGGFIAGFVLSGTTTDADITGLLPTAMPDPVTQWARFQCRGTPGANSITLPLEAMTALLGTNPTRIETQLFRITADLNQPFTSAIVGHGFIGYTDVPQQ